MANCERPAPPAPTPPPAPEPPTLVIAYSDLNKNHLPDAGDVMISKIVDTNGDKAISVGDTILMGMYPTSLTPTPSDFAKWGVTSHTIGTVLTVSPDEVEVATTTGGDHRWYADSTASFDQYDSYLEQVLEGGGSADFEDRNGLGLEDSIDVRLDAPSKPSTPVDLVELGATDGSFVDVEFYF